MRIRLAKKITRGLDKAPKYLKPSLRNSYWFKKIDESLNHFYCVTFCEGWKKCKFHNRIDHRIVNPQILYARWCARKQINGLIAHAKVSPLRYRDLSRFTNRLKKYRV